MDISERAAGEVTVVTLSGKLNLGDATQRLYEKVTSLVQQGRKNIVLNLGDVAAIDSGGLGELVRTYTTLQRHGGRMKIASLPKRVEDLLVTTRLVTVFDTYEDENAAINSFGG